MADIFKKINQDNLYFSDNNFHLDSDGHIVLLANSMWMKFNNEGKLLVESRAEGNIDSFLADSSDNLFAISDSRQNILYKYSSDFKILKKISFDDNNMIGRNIVGIDLQNNLHQHRWKCDW